VVAEVLAGGECFGRRAANGRSVMVEFVSANPTGPLHVGHARQAALGDALCNLLDPGLAGHARVLLQRRRRADRHLARPRRPPAGPEARRRRLARERPTTATTSPTSPPTSWRKTVHADDREFTASGDPDDLDGIRQFAVAYLRHEQDLDLQAFGVQFDHYYLESSLYTERPVEHGAALVAAGKTYEKDGALWLRTTDYGDDKDRVMRKSDGSLHLLRARRGLPHRQVGARLRQGHQRAGHRPPRHHRARARRLQAAGVGIPPGYPDYVLHKMVTVMKGGQEVKISKRAGSYVTLRDLIDWTSRDAVRFFLISRKADTEFVFDVDLALKARATRTRSSTCSTRTRASARCWRSVQRAACAASRWPQADLSRC
jgi:arginyl-tRNA synthetase